MLINYVRRGEGKPLLLVHGLGSNWRSWKPVLGHLARHRSVIAVDLPGFGKSPPLSGEVSVRTMADAITDFVREHDLVGTDAVGSSLGARLVIELARRGGVVGAVVSLGPGGFWSRWERYAYLTSVCVTMRLVRAMHLAAPGMSSNALSRTLFLMQLSAQSSSLKPSLAFEEMRAFACAQSFSAILRDLVHGEPQLGAPAGSLSKPLVIGWGRLDRLCFPRQAARAQSLFPDARLHWFERCGHFPHWDVPEETAKLILETTDD